MASNGGIGGEVYCGCCIGRRRVEFETGCGTLILKNEEREKNKIIILFRFGDMKSELPNM